MERLVLVSLHLVQSHCKSNSFLSFFIHVGVLVLDHNESDELEKSLLLALSHLVKLDQVSILNGLTEHFVVTKLLIVFSLYRVDNESSSIWWLS